MTSENQGCIFSHFANHAKYAKKLVKMSKNTSWKKSILEEVEELAKNTSRKKSYF